MNKKVGEHILTKKTALGPISVPAIALVGSGLVLGGIGVFVFMRLYDYVQSRLFVPAKLSQQADLACKIATYNRNDTINVMEITLESGPRVKFEQKFDLNHQSYVTVKMNGYREERCPAEFATLDDVINFYRDDISDPSSKDLYDTYLPGHLQTLIEELRAEITPYQIESDTASCAFEDVESAVNLNGGSLDSDSQSIDLQEVMSDVDLNHCNCDQESVFLLNGNNSEENSEENGVMLITQSNRVSITDSRFDESDSINLSENLNDQLISDYDEIREINYLEAESQSLIEINEKDAGDSVNASSTENAYSSEFAGLGTIEQRSIDPISLDVTDFVEKFRAMLSRIGTPEFDEVDLANFKYVYNMEGEDLTVEFLQDTKQIPPLDEMEREILVSIEILKFENINMVELNSAKRIGMSESADRRDTVQRLAENRFRELVHTVYRPNDPCGLGSGKEKPLYVPPDSLQEGGSGNQLLLKKVNRDVYDPSTHFGCFGYSEGKENTVNFRIIHPLVIIAFQNKYRTPFVPGIDVLNWFFFQVQLEVSKHYYDNKPAIDALLREVYDLHGGTLHVRTLSGSRNQMI